MRWITQEMLYDTDLFPCFVSIPMCSEKTAMVLYRHNGMALTYPFHNMNKHKVIGATLDLSVPSCLSIVSIKPS
ncbi:hypothetical protein VNO77_01129 [Canavalia gladiata]|uniref:Uncharacterized protein n=1 Tax=Canavalia gladiata TaxID=3824 RepID=A0AAN9R509_CANGL